MNKRGISAVVATVLIILITVAGVAIIWGAIIPMIRDNLDFSSLEGRVYVVTSGGYTFYDASTGLAKVQVKRDMDDGVMNRIKIDFSVDGNSVSSSVVAPDPGNTKVYTFDLSGYGEPESVSVAPIFVSGSGKEKVGSVTSDVDVGTGNIGSYGFAYNLEEEYFSDIPTDGLVSMWQFSGDPKDSLGDNDVGVYDGASIIDGELVLDGVNDYAKGAADSSLDLNSELTMSAWIKKSTIGQDRVISLFQSEGSSQPWYSMFIENSNKIRVQLKDPTNTQYASYIANTAIPTDSWHHIVVVFDRPDINFYLDGKYDGSATWDFDVGSSAAPYIYIGARGDLPSSEFFSGHLDDIMIYNRSLSGKEIELVYEFRRKG